MLKKWTAHWARHGLTPQQGNDKFTGVVLISGASGRIFPSATTSTELGYLVSRNNGVATKLYTCGTATNAALQVTGAATITGALTVTNLVFGTVLVGLAATAIGFFARDNSVTSKDAGATDNDQK